MMMGVGEKLAAWAKGSYPFKVKFTHLNLLD